MRKFLAMLLAILMLLSMVACGAKEEAPEVKEEETKTEAPKEEEKEELVQETTDVQESTVESTSDGPQSGGILTVADLSLSMQECQGWDIHSSPSITSTWWLNPVQEYLMQGNFLEKGPRGTGENDFNTFQAEWSEDLITGWLVESWEWSDEPMGVSMKVRDGIQWSANESLGMEARDVTAEDIANWLNSYRSSAKASKMTAFTDENPAEVTGEDTLFLNFTQPFASWQFVVGYALYANVYPMEQTALENVNWENVTGTGPFVITNYTTGIGGTYGRNDNWWASEIEIDGETYNAPFIDELNLPIFGDPSSAISALMSGQVDIATQVPVSYKDTILAACPDMNIKEAPSGSAINIRFNYTNGPCAELEFRQALMLGTDNEAITALVDGGVTGGFPFSSALGEAIYTPLDEMPEAAAKLYTYDPEAAAAAIADLGYAGQTITINYTNANQDIVAICEVLADQWSLLGINPVLNLVDSATFSSYWTGDGSNFEGVILNTGANSKTSRGIENERTCMYIACSGDPYFNELMDNMMAEPDAAAREAILKESAIYFIEQCNEIGLVSTSCLTCWWPWVQNYYGETDSGGSGNIANAAAYAWVDAAMKTDMGF